MGKKVAILQSNYIPWKGYFDIIDRADEFLFHDDLQYTKNDWRNRNKIKTPNGLKWLTVPCGKNEKRLICEVQLTDRTWQKKHWSQIVGNYSRTKYFDQFKDFFEDFYLNRNWKNLSEMNQYLIVQISQQFLDIQTRFDDSRRHKLKKTKGERVIELLKKVNADEYISGPAAKNYLDKNFFAREGIEIIWMDYSHYPEYLQQFGGFEHNVSILDVLFNCGDSAKQYIRPGI